MNPEKWLEYQEAALDWSVRTVPSLTAALIMGWAGWWAIGKANAALQRTMGLRRLEPGLITFLSTLFVLGSRTLLFITVAGQLGFPTTSLAAVVGAVGLAVGFALQGSLANLAGGVLILLFKPYRVGDRISASDFTGTVKEIQIFNTILSLDNGALALLPNGPVANSVVVNHSAHEPVTSTWLVELPKGGAWEDDARRLQELASRTGFEAAHTLMGWTATHWKVEIQAAVGSDETTRIRWWQALSTWEGSSAQSA